MDPLERLEVAVQRHRDALAHEDATRAERNAAIVAAHAYDIRPSRVAAITGLSLDRLRTIREDHGKDTT